MNTDAMASAADSASSRKAGWPATCAQLRASSGPELLIAATDVANGLPRLFRRREMTVECVLASACLPTIHHAVTIDGHAYWDGGFSANPDLVTLGRESPFGDTLIVKLTDRQAGRADDRARDHARISRSPSTSRCCAMYR
jgi:NTE family protein